MYLEKLEVQGFKSFATKNSLLFPGIIGGEKRGITSIVGPNGSGKSNVADAVRWVLGEQSLKTLRGKKSEDVIFSGSDQKNKLSMAEVSLILNNEDKSALKINIIENGEEEVKDEKGNSFLEYSQIVITRRLFRSGESEYLINGQRVRLSDIQLLLAKANFGQRTYSVIGQGMVEGFLNTNASERKDFFDEATGVKQFQIKREASLSKLQSSYENLQQVDMLLTEIRPRLKILTRQVDKLKKRSELESELKGYQLEYYSFIWQEIDQRLIGFNKRFLELEKIQIEKAQRLDKLNQELNKIKTDDLSGDLRAVELSLEEQRGERNNLVGGLARLQAELEINLEAQGQFDVSWLNRKQGELTEQKSQIIAEVTSLETDLENTPEQNLNIKLTEIDQDIRKAGELKRANYTKKEERERLVKQINRLEASLEANLEAQGQFDVSWLSNKHEELSQQKINLEQEIEELKNNNFGNLNSELNQQLQAVEKQIDSLNSLIREANRWLEQNKNRDNKEEISRLINEFLAGLENLEKESDLDLIKKELKKLKDDFEKSITELITGQNEEKMSEIKNHKDKIISLTTEKQVLINQINEEKLKESSARERLRLLSDQLANISREVVDITAKLVKSQVKFDSEKINQEKAELLKQSELLSEEIENSEKNIHALERYHDRQEIISTINEARLNLSAKRERVRLLKSQITSIDRELTDIAAKITKSQVKFDSEKIDQEKKIINEKIAVVDEKIRILKEKSNALEEVRQGEKEKLFTAQKGIQAIQSELNTINEELNEIKISAARQETKLEDLENNIRGDELNLGEIKSHQAPESLDREKAGKKIGDLKNQLEQIGGLDPETEKEYEDTKSRHDFLSAQTEDLNEAIKSLEKIINELDVNIKSRFEEEFKLISQKFNEYFKILFNGGDAKIVKVESGEEEKGQENQEEIGIVAEKLKTIKSLRKLNATGSNGIEIQAIPPGKKIQNVAMLSGGERALTAIALICAIISANPSPFVVLDEVDAALDEANSERLAQILDDLSHKTQFITITHNRALMKKANILYGVTMQSDGVSKLLSIRLEDTDNIR
ncbi:MAG: AAA family ATPase [Candidatus Falkowbacteria bacterium]|nr:AAA family ATPase [Candidatus Falkowbacteria bacterium]